MKMLYIAAMLTELFGISLVSAGLVYEHLTGADLGYMLISGGSAVIALGSLLFAKVAPWLRSSP